MQPQAMEGLSPCQTSAAPMEKEDSADPNAEIHQSNIRIGDTICLQSVRRNMYVNLDEESSGITWHNESESCFFTLYPAVGQSGNTLSQDGGAICDGAVVCLFAPNGYFLSFDGERLAANRAYYVAGPSAEFVVHVPGDGILRNRGKLFLRNRASLRMLEVETQDMVDSVQEDCTPVIGGHLADMGNLEQVTAGRDSEAGCFQVRKVFEKHAYANTTPRKRRLSSAKRRSRLLVPKLPQYVRRFSRDCAYMSKQAPRGFMLRSAIFQTAVAVA